jgi:hypothetical protein
LNHHQQMLKPLVLNLLSLIERVQALAADQDAARRESDGIAYADEYIRAAIEVLPFAGALLEEAELEALPPILPAAQVFEPELEPEYATDSAPPSNEWLLGDDGDFGGR